MNSVEFRWSDHWQSLPGHFRVMTFLSIALIASYGCLLPVSPVGLEEDLAAMKQKALVLAAEKAAYQDAEG